MGRMLPRTTLWMARATETVVYPPSAATAGEHLVAHAVRTGAPPQLPALVWRTCRVRADDAWAYVVWVGDEGEVHTALVPPEHPTWLGRWEPVGRLALLFRWAQNTAGPDRWLGPGPVRALAVTATRRRDGLRGPDVETGAGGMSSVWAVALAAEDLRRRSQVRRSSAPPLFISCLVLFLIAGSAILVSLGAGTVDVLRASLPMLGVLTILSVRRLWFARKYRPYVAPGGS